MQLGADSEADGLPADLAMLTSPISASLGRSRSFSGMSQSAGNESDLHTSVNTVEKANGGLHEGDVAAGHNETAAWQLQSSFQSLSPESKDH